MPNYDSEFFKYVNSGALQSARTLLPEVYKQIKPSSVLDVGSGQGGWLKAWKELGAQEVCGIDGDYVNREQLLIEASEFVAIDLAKPFDLKRRFDLVQTLEVGEHLPTESSADFVASLVKHGDHVLFSAAAKGQGGDHHVNEQHYDYWRELFAQHNYVPIDFLRPLLKDQDAIEPWYRYNVFLYVAESRLSDLPRGLRGAQVPDHQKLADISPAIYKVRKLLVRLLPTPVATKIAKVKEAWVLRNRTRNASQTQP